MLLATSDLPTISDVRVAVNDVRASSPQKKPQRKSEQRLFVEGLLGAEGLLPDRGALSYDRIAKIIHGKCLQYYPKDNGGRAGLKKMIQEIYRAA
jgi:hypothetical protein